MAARSTASDDGAETPIWLEEWDENSDSRGQRLMFAVGESGGWFRWTSSMKAVAESQPEEDEGQLGKVCEAPLWMDE